MYNFSTKNALGLISLISILALAAFIIPSPNNGTINDVKNNLVKNNHFAGGGTGDIFGFYTPISSSGVLPIDIVCFPRMNGVATTLGTPLSTINYGPTPVLLPTSTSSYDPVTKDLVCLVSGERKLFTYNDVSCSSGIVNQQSAVTAPVFLNGQLYGIDIESNGYPTGPTINIDIAIDIQSGFLALIGGHQFTPSVPFIFNHEQTSSTTNGIDELYFVSGSNLIIVEKTNTLSPLICFKELDNTGQYSFHGIEFQKQGELLALRRGINTSNLDLVRINLTGCIGGAPTTTVLYNLLLNVAPSPPGWVLNHEFYSTTLDTCNQLYYLSTRHDINSSSKLIEIDIIGGTHVEQIFPEYLFGIEMKNLSCDTTSCCTDYETFFNAAINVHPNGTLGNCMVHFEATGLDSCLQISYLWGDSPSVYEGGYPNNTPVWHTYPGSGPYTVCYKVEQIEPDGTICWDYEQCEDFELVCDTCICGSFKDMFARTGGAPSQKLSCGEPAVTLNCPQPGQSVHFTGNFECNGDACLIDAPVFWTLDGPNGFIMSGSTVANPYFGLTLLPTYFNTTGQYTLSLTGQCGNHMCSCIIEFFVDCPDLCPCDIEDLMDDVDDGFANLIYANSCTACFSPFSLSDCVTVEWYIDNINTIPIATSYGNQTICHDFVNPGNYTVIMVVTQLRPDSSICEVFTYSQSVSVTCISHQVCGASAFPNPEFGEDAVAGGLNSDGNVLGWTALRGDPLVEEGISGSLDGWTILLSNPNDISDILTTIEPICLEKGIGNLSVEHGIKTKGIKSSISFLLFSGDNIEPPDSNDWNPIRCLQLAKVDLSPIDTGTWVNLQIPYDLSGWEAIDTCAGSDFVWVWPVVAVHHAATGSATNPTARRTSVWLDNYCFSGVVSSLQGLPEESEFEIFPNPTSGNFTVEMSELNSAIIDIVIYDIWGQTILSERIQGSNKKYQFSIASQPAGIYIVKLMNEGHHFTARKVIKW